ncbi:hypothetical protein BDR03DRAFT_957576 [Suillus americanus]|nr:hypothetical protein BDR03DRAFT_957576 [Suillus americanus]
MPTPSTRTPNAACQSGSIWVQAGTLTKVGQMELTASRNNPAHRRRKDCPCPDCESDRSHLGCPKPFKCRDSAKAILSCIPLKWNPEDNMVKYAPDLTSEQKAKNKKAVETGDFVTFDPKVTFSSPLEDGFKAFTPKAPPAKEPAHQLPPPPGATVEETLIVVKGTHQTDIHGDLQSGGGAWFGNEDRYAQIH